MKNRDFESNISNCIHNMNQNAQNILKLDKKHTQEEHANEIQATQPIISMYKNGKRDIDLRFFVYLHTEFGFSLDQLINSILTESEIMMHLQSSGSVAVPSSEDRSREFIDIRKYTGLYFAYYFFNGDATFDGKAGDNLLDYGLIDIYEGAPPSPYKLEARAIMGIHDPDSLTEIYLNVHKLASENREKFLQDFSVNGAKHIYRGNLTLPPEHNNYFSINLVRGLDNASMLFQRPTLNDRNDYLGGLGTINSISKKRSLPCVQYIALSKNSLNSASPEEIASYLYMGKANPLPFNAHEIYTFIDKLYRTLNLGPEQSSVIIEPYLTHTIGNIISEQSLRFHQIDEEDRKFYELIKTYLPKKEKHHVHHEQ
jgi:predicted transcriptional regulator